MNTSPFFALFPGQGSQHVGMAKDLHDNFRVATETFEEASDSIHVNIRKLCFEGPESDLTLTENTQPCLLAASIAAFRVAQSEMGIIPKAAAGHSLGEYSALVAIGALPFGTAVRWVRARGQVMQTAVPAGQGTMAAIMGLEDGAITRLCEMATMAAKQKRESGENSQFTVDCLVEPANFNAPGQTVVAGSSDAVQETVALIKGGGIFAGGKAIPLSVSAPFHCRLMAPARSRMAELFSQSLSSPSMPICPYVPNRTARLTQEPGLIYELLVDQMDHPVLWKQSILSILEHGYTQAIEFGPGRVLTGLTKRIAQTSAKSIELAQMNDGNSLKVLENFLQVKS